MKELIRKLKHGVIYHPTRHLKLVNDDATNYLMKEAAEAIENLGREKEEILQETEAILVRMQAKIDGLKSGEPVAWRGVNFTEADENWLYRDVDEPFTDSKFNNIGEALYLHSKPAPPLLTDDEITKEHCKVKMSFEWDRGFESGARWAERKVRSQYEQ